MQVPAWVRNLVASQICVWEGVSPAARRVGLPATFNRSNSRHGCWLFFACMAKKQLVCHVDCLFCKFNFAACSVKCNIKVTLNRFVWCYRRPCRDVTPCVFKVEIKRSEMLECVRLVIGCEKMVWSRHSGANNTNSNFQQVRQNLFIESKVSKVQSENRGRCIVGRSKPNIAFQDMIPLVKHGPAVTGGCTCEKKGGCHTSLDSHRQHASNLQAANKAPRQKSRLLRRFTVSANKACWSDSSSAIAWSSAACRGTSSARTPRAEEPSASCVPAGEGPLGWRCWPLHLPVQVRLGSWSPDVVFADHAQDAMTLRRDK